MAAPKGNKYAVGNKGGGKSKYKNEYCKAIIDFFSVEPTKEVPVTTTFKNGTIKESTEERPTHLPFFADFAHSIGSNPQRLLIWCEKFKEFKEAYTHAKSLQKQHLVTCGLLGLYNPKFAVFTATNITEMRNKQEITGKDGAPLVPLQIVVKAERVGGG